MPGAACDDREESMSLNNETLDQTQRQASRLERVAEVDLVNAYLKEVGATPLLTAAQEVDLAKRIEAGLYAAELLRAEAAGETKAHPPTYRRQLRAVAADGHGAKEHMIKANLRLVVSVAKRHSTRGLSLLDVVQEGNLGLIRAVEKFDYAKGFKFSTYAMWWIRQAIERGFAEQCRTIRLPIHVLEELSKIDTAERRLRLELNKEPTIEDISAATSMSVARLSELREISRSSVSLNTPIGAEGDTVIADLIEDTDSVLAEDVVEHKAFAAQLRTVVDALPERQARIITLRYGLNDGRARTLQEVATELGLTRERIRQLEKESMRFLQDTKQREPLAGWVA